MLKDILREIDNTLTEDDLDHIIEEVDEDGSGTMDFDEFQEMMMGWNSSKGTQFTFWCITTIFCIYMTDEEKLFYWSYQIGMYEKKPKVDNYACSQLHI